MLSLGDSDGEVSFNIWTVPRGAVSTSLSSGTTTVPDTQSEDDTDTGVHPQPTESEVSVSTGQVEPACSPSSPSEKLAKLKELRQRTEMIMERVRSSPQLRPSHKEKEDESVDSGPLAGVTNSPPQDQ